MNKDQLEYEMKSKGITVTRLCKAIHISRSTFYRKCNGLSEVTQGEIQKIVGYIGLDAPVGIFFQEEVL